MSFVLHLGLDAQHIADRRVGCKRGPPVANARKALPMNVCLRPRQRLGCCPEEQADERQIAQLCSLVSRCCDPLAQRIASSLRECVVPAVAAGRLALLLEVAEAREP